MSGDKRSVSTDALETLGTIIDEKAGRDAIHVAVEPLQAAVDLEPGQDVGLVESGLAGPTEGQNLGIVDPFLQRPVKKGQWFWMLIYPRQITSLRHVWAHPAFEAQKHDRARELSELWLRRFIEGTDCPSYERVMRLIMAPNQRLRLADYADYGESYIDGESMHFDGLDAHAAIPPEFWDHVEVVTGVRQTRRPSYFTCSC